MAEVEKVKKTKNKKVLEEKHEEDSDIEQIDPMEELRKEIALLKSQIPKQKQPKEIVEKPKKERTEKQKEAFTKALEARKSQVEVRKKMKEEAEEKAKQILEEKILKKAIKVKKKQIKQLEMLKPTESESEEEDNEEVEKPEPIGARPSKTPTASGIAPEPKIESKKEIKPITIQQTQPTTSKYRFF